MSKTAKGFLVRLVVVLASLAFAVGGVACSSDKGGDGADTSRAEEPAPSQAEPERKPEDEPQYGSWQVYINDDDSAQQGSITYEIALNFTATNPSSDPAGTYTGKAVAKTTTSGDVGGAQLNANAIAQSGQLEFTLEDPTAGGALAPLDGEEAATLSGTGTITMKAAGSGTVGSAGGSFQNTSSQQITVRVVGEKVTLTVPISGNTYTFEGLLSGK